MSSLSAILGVLANIVGPRPREGTSLQPLTRTREEIKACLDECLEPEEMVKWHAEKRDWVRVEGNCDRLTMLCDEVAAKMFTATLKAAQLKQYAGGDASLPEDINCDRQLLNDALRNLISALEKFRVVGQTPVLRVKHNMDMVLEYLKMVFEMAVVLGPVAYPHNHLEETFGYWTEHLDMTGLREFRFDDGEDYQSIDDQTLRGVLGPLEATPQSYLPSNPTPPAVYLNPGIYGAPILRNALQFDVKQDVEDLVQEYRVSPITNSSEIGSS